MSLPFGHALESAFLPSIQNISIHAKIYGPAQHDPNMDHL